MTSLPHKTKTKDALGPRMRFLSAPACNLTRCRVSGLHSYLLSIPLFISMATAKVSAKARTMKSTGRFSLKAVRFVSSIFSIGSTWKLFCFQDHNRAYCPEKLEVVICAPLQV